LRSYLEQHLLSGAPNASLSLALRDPNGVECSVALRLAGTYNRNDVARRGGGVIRMLRDNIG